MGAENKVPQHSLEISVLLPVHFPKKSKHNVLRLVRAIESVRCQDYPSDYELLILDDGSSPPIEDQLGKHTLFDQIQIFRSARNQGLSHTLNKGLAYARFPYIGRIDADDEWLDGKISSQMQVLLEDPDLTIVGTGMHRIRKDGSIIDTHIRPKDWQGILDFMHTVGCPFPHGSVIGLREVYRLLGGYPQAPEFAHAEDFALWVRWLRFFKPAMIEEPLYKYLVSKSSISGAYTARQAKASQLIHSRYRDLNIAYVTPQLLEALSKDLGFTILGAGLFAFWLWKYGGKALVKRSAVPHLRRLLPDRLIRERNSFGNGFEPSNQGSPTESTDRETDVLITITPQLPMIVE